MASQEWPNFLIKLYEHNYIRITNNNLQEFDLQQKAVAEVYQLISKRSDTICNFLEGENIFL